jgi:hypothetical protein
MQMRGRWLLALLGGFGLGGCGLQAVGLGPDAEDSGAKGAAEAAASSDGPVARSDGGAGDASSADSSLADRSVAPDSGVTADSGAVDTGHTDAGHAEAGPADAAREVGTDSGSILVITGGPYSLEDEDAGLCSINSDTAASFTIDNSRSGPIDLDWIGYPTACSETKYGTIGPGGSHAQSTYVTHVWRVTDTASKAFLGEFVLNAPGPYTVDVH